MSCNSEKAKPEMFVFETAYCLVQVGEIPKALDILIKAGNKDTRMQYLLGQIVHATLIANILIVL